MSSEYSILGLLNRKYLGEISHIFSEWMLVVAMGMEQCTIKDNWTVLGKLSKAVSIKGGNLIKSH